MIKPAITIIIELPPKELRPNYRPQPRAKQSATARYRRACLESAMAAAYTCDLASPIDQPVVGVAYYHATRRYLDADNILASLKAAFDGLTDAGIWQDDSQCAYLPVWRGKDEDKPRVELSVFDGGDFPGLFDWKTS